MKDSLKFLRVSELNIDELAEGMSELHFAVRGQRRNPAYWRWRYLNSPVGKSNLSVAVRGGQVVGKYGLLYVPLIVKGKQMVAGMMDISIHPLERSWQCYRGLVEMSIVESQKDNLAFRFGISSSRVIELNRRLGVMNLGRAPIYLGFLNAARILEGRSVPYPLSLAGWLVQPIVGLRIRGGEIFDLDIQPVKSFDSSFDELWSAIAKSRTVSIVKNAKYLNWRYVKYPGRWYGRLAAYRRRKLEGLVIFRTSGSRHRSFVLELLVRDDNPETMRALLVRTFRELRMKGTGHIIASFPTKSPAAAVLKELGFKSWGTRLWSMHVIIATNPPKETCPKLDLKSCNFSLGDLTGY